MVEFDDKVLLQELKRWRTEKSLAAGLPAYTIMHDSTINELVVKKPQNLAQLLDIKGIGQNRVDQYGTELLKIIKKYVSEKTPETEQATSNITNNTLNELARKILSLEKEMHNEKSVLDEFEDEKTNIEIKTQIEIYNEEKPPGTKKFKNETSRKIELHERTRTNERWNYLDEQIKKLKKKRNENYIEVQFLKRLFSIKEIELMTELKNDH